MATNNSKSVPTKYVASLLKISDYNKIAPIRSVMRAPTRAAMSAPTRSVMRAPTRSVMRAPARSVMRAPRRAAMSAPARAAMSAPAKQSFGLNDLSEDLRFYITNEYSKLVNKAKNIAEKLIEIMKSDYENPTQYKEALNERIQAKNILKTITDIDTINEIRHIINNQSKQLGNYYFPIFVLIQERFIELVVIINQQKKLEILNNEEKKLKLKLTEIKHILNNEIKNITDVKYKHIYNDIKLLFEETTNIFDKINNYFLNIKKSQDEAKKILTQNYRNTLSDELSKRQRIIEDTILKIEYAIKFYLNEINNLLNIANKIKISILKQKIKEEEKK